MIGWRIYARFRRLVGRQRLSQGSPLDYAGHFPGPLIVLLGVAAQLRIPNGSGGLRVAWVWALCSVSLAEQDGFRSNEKGLFYTPNAHLGIALSLLFVARIVYRLSRCMPSSRRCPMARMTLHAVRSRSPCSGFSRVTTFPMLSVWCAGGLASCVPSGSARRSSEMPGPKPGNFAPSGGVRGVLPCTRLFCETRPAPPQRRHGRHPHGVCREVFPGKSFPGQSFLKPIFE